MSNKKNLLNENTIRRMMKLASVDSLSDSFISTKYTPINEEAVEEGTKKGQNKKTGRPHDKAFDADYRQKEKRDGQRTGEEAFTTKKDMNKKTGPGKAFMEEELNEDEEEKKELDATEDELSDMDSEADRERDELEADDEAMEDEVTLTDDEARDIIALADKLRAAMGEEEMEGAMDAMDDAEDDMDDAMDDIDDAMKDEPGMGNHRMEEELFEAALKGLDIEIVEDKKVQLENLSKEIYKKVVARLLQESKK